MKNRFNIFAYILCCMVAGLLFASCEKDEDSLETPRLFKPQVAVDNSIDNQLMVAWLPMKGAVQYKMEVSRDTFKTIDKSVIVDAPTSKAVIDNLLAAQDYGVRVQAIHADASFNSKFVEIFATTASIFVSPNPASEVLDIGFKVKWERRGAEVTDVIIKDPVTNEVVQEVEVTEQEALNGIKEIRRLEGDTQYLVEVYSDGLLRGKGLIKTRIPIENAIDLRDLEPETRDIVFSDTITKLPEGSIVLLRRGEVYNLTSGAKKLTKSIKFISGYDYSAELAKIVFIGRMEFDNDVTIGSIVFQDLILQGNTTGAYLLSTSNTNCNVGEVKFDGCIISTFRGVFRIQNEEIVDKLTFNNCILDTFGDFAIVRIYQSDNNLLRNLTMTNSTIYNARRAFAITRQKYEPHTMLIENCTFFSSPWNGNALIDFGTSETQVQGAVTIRNCIFAGAGGGDANTTIGLRLAPNVSGNVENSYKTADFVMGTFPIPSLIDYSKVSTELFRNPASADFKIIDMSFLGRNNTGDPRWRP
jgi:hypothetical protein